MGLISKEIQGFQKQISQLDKEGSLNGAGNNVLLEDVTSHRY
jgi:hypothetical protein